MARLRGRTRSDTLTCPRLAHTFGDGLAESAEQPPGPASQGNVPLRLPLKPSSRRGLFLRRSSFKISQMTRSRAEGQSLLQRLLQRWREADPWLSMLAATVVLTFASRPEGFRPNGLTFVATGTIILFIGVFLVPILCDMLAAFISPDLRDKVGALDYDDETIDFIRVSRVVIVLLVVWLWGWTPTSFGSDDPGDRSSSPAQVGCTASGPECDVLQGEGYPPQH